MLIPVTSAYTVAMMRIATTPSVTKITFCFIFLLFTILAPSS